MRSALDSTYLRMTVCYMEQELEARTQPTDADKPDYSELIKNMETLLARMA